MEEGASPPRWALDKKLGEDDDDRGMEMDIQALLSEFGDFGDFFENDVLPFGEVSEYLYYNLKRISSFDFHFFLLYNPEF